MRLILEKGSCSGWCSIPRLNADTGTSIALILFFGPVDRFCLGRDSTRSCLCAQFWPFVIVRTGIRAQVGNFFCLYVDYGGFSFSQNKILCAGAPGVNRPSPRLAPPRVRMLAKKRKKKEKRRKNFEKMCKNHQKSKKNVRKSQNFEM